MTDISSIENALTNSGIEAGFETVVYGKLRDQPLLAFTRTVSPERPHIYISSGVHGDEPAAVEIVMELLRSDLLRHDFNYTICPLVNPTGLSLKSRENHEGIDLNRDFLNPQSLEVQKLNEFIDKLTPMDLSICLHEDWESTGFYLYYIDQASATLARTVVEEVSKVGPIDPSDEIDGRKAIDGIIDPPSPFDPIERTEGWPEAFYLYSKNPHPHFTLETPSALPMHTRVEMGIKAVETLLAKF